MFPGLNIKEEQLHHFVVDNAANMMVMMVTYIYLIEQHTTLYERALVCPVHIYMICGEELNTQGCGHALVSPCVRKLQYCHFCYFKDIAKCKRGSFMLMCPIEFITCGTTYRKYRNVFAQS